MPAPRSRSPLALLFAAAIGVASAEDGWSRVPLEVARFSHIRIGSIPSTDYTNAAGALVMRVDRWASLLLLPFDRPRLLQQVRLRWKSRGARDVRSAAEEEAKSGDDQRLRVGLLVAGDAPTVPFFAPAWAKSFRDRLRAPASRMIELIAGSLHAPGARWKSPFSDSIECVAMNAEPDGLGWTISAGSLEAPTPVVGLWLMADGDNSGSRIETTVSWLELR